MIDDKLKRILEAIESNQVKANELLNSINESLLKLLNNNASETTYNYKSFNKFRPDTQIGPGTYIRD